MTKIKTLPFLLLLSPFCGLNEHFPNKNETNSLSFQQDQEKMYVDLTKIVRSEASLFMDLAVFVTREALQTFDQSGVDIESFMAKVFSRVSVTYAIHNIFIAVRKFEILVHAQIPRIDHSPNLGGLHKYIEEQKFEFDGYIFFDEFQEGATIGSAFVGMLCTSSAVVSIKTREHVYSPNKTAASVAHEIGHLFGFQHTDHDRNCECAVKKENCLMYSLALNVNMKFPRSIENCRMKELTAKLRRYPCLLKPMDSLERIFKKCGDGYEDTDEQCDCAFPELCFNLTDQGKCCDSATCQFSSNKYSCASGPCCEQCHFIKGKVCGPSYGACDVAEVCNGQGKNCPNDVITENFKLCNDDTGFCYDGMCTDFSQICKYVYNNGENYFTERCVDEIRRIRNHDCRDEDWAKAVNYKSICSRKLDVCSHFICARKSNGLRHTYPYQLGSENCFVPDEQLRFGTLKHALNYMKCSRDGSKVCLNGSCTLRTKGGKSCDNKDCPILKSSNTFSMNKIIYLPPFQHGYRLFSYQHFYPMATTNTVIPSSRPERSKNAIIFFVLLLAIGFLLVTFFVIYLVRRSKKKPSTESL